MRIKWNVKYFGRAQQQTIDVTFENDMVRRWNKIGLSQHLASLF
jgi:hypothetical protein